MHLFNICFRQFSAKAAAMVKVLNVAEKNDAAKSIADVITRGRFNRREGFSRFNKIYEFEYNLFNQRCSMTMTSVSGHLLGLEFVGQYRKWNTCSPVALFDVPVEKYCPENFIDIKRTLEREVKGAQYLVIWTDCDREGENIGFEVIQVCKAVKPNIKVLRAKFSEITPQAIARACANLGPPDQLTSDAVDARSELDLRIGASFTRFQTMRLQKIFPNVLAEQLISYGSCQFPTLGFVVERYKQVQAFIPEPFWKLKVLLKVEETTVDFNWKRNRLFDYMACFILYQHCLESPVAKIIDTKGKSKSKWRPQALDTVELEKLASRKLRISAKETMKIAEKLYTSGYISYPRTETNIFPKELDLPGMVEAQTRDPNWGEFAQRVSERGPTPRNGNKTDNAHPPIHPIKYTDSLHGNDKRVYEFIVRHFLACCSQDAQGFETTVEIEVALERFTAQGLMVTAKNYLEVYIYEKWNAKEIPVFEKGDEFEPSAIEMNNGETSPPPLLSEADLIALMDKHGIGTDATHAEHIETIKSRNYVGVRPDGRFVPGQLGMGLVEENNVDPDQMVNFSRFDQGQYCPILISISLINRHKQIQHTPFKGYDSMGYEMSKPHLRAELEADLKEICLGRKQKQAVLDVQVKKYKDVFIEACRQAEKIDAALSQYLGEEAQPAGADDSLNVSTTSSLVMKCPLCGQDMLLRAKKDNKGFYVGCMSFPNCKNAIWLPDCVTEASVEESTCPDCGPDVHQVKLKFKRGSVPPIVPLEYLGCLAGCDNLLTTEVGIRAPRANPAGAARNQSTPRDGGNSNSSSANNTGRATTGQQRNMSTSARQTHTNTPVSSHTNTSNQSRSVTQTGGAGTRTINSMFSPSPVGNQRMPGGSPWSSMSSRGDGAMKKPLGIVTGTVMNDSGSSAGGNEVVCNCGNDAVQLTVRKEGPNTGRQFYKCNGSACSFFLWADEAGSGNQNNQNNQDSGHTSNRLQASSYSSSSWTPGNTRASHPGPARTTPPGPGQYGGAQGDGVCCKCGQPAKSLTVQKEGPNKGRPFYGCPAPRGEGCNFFQWGDEDPGGGGGNNQNSNRYQAGSYSSSNHTPANTRPTQSGAGPYPGAQGDGISCKCGQPAKSLTVQKEGPNKGRPFYGCPAPRAEGCNFFQWGDEDPGGGGGFSQSGFGGGGYGHGVGGANRGGGGVSGRGGKKRAASDSSGGPAARKAKKCGLCGVEGHTKRTCPHR